MSVFDLPRVHFAGVAVTRLPTGPRSGLLDMATNRAVDGAGRPWPTGRPATEYLEHMRSLGGRFEPDGTPDPEGRFSTVAGWNVGGNGHFWFDAAVVGCEREPGRVDVDDPLVGRAVDVWGHHLPYTAGTANRARVFDVDPASDMTTTVMVGRLAVGRLGRSHDVGYLLSGDVSGFSPPRWQNPHHLHGMPDHPLAGWLRRSVVHQFVVDEAGGPTFLPGADTSPALTALRARLHAGEIDGLVVQFALTTMATPTGNDQPDFWDLRGTIAGWHADEARTCPAGRLLTARRRRAAGHIAVLHNASVDVGERVGLNLVTALPVNGRAAVRGPGPTHQHAGQIDHGDLELRTASGVLLARVPRDWYLGAGFRLSSGLLTVERADGAREHPDEALQLCAADGTVLLDEEETVVVTDDASVFLEHPRRSTGEDFAVQVAVRSWVRGRPRTVEGIGVAQFADPRALPSDPVAQSPDTRPEDLRIVDVRARPGDDWAAGAVIDTGHNGRASFAVRGARGGATRLLLRAPDQPPPAGTTATAAFDDGDAGGYWAAVGSMAVRVLPDHWHLDELPDAVTFETLYREAFCTYELLYSFMRSEVMSLADEFKVAPYARLSWHVSAFEHRDTTYYMPPSRDMSAPQIRLMLRYLLALDATRQTPPTMVAHVRPAAGAITTRHELERALRQAAAIEMATMQQYLYAAYSIPLDAAGRALVERGEWTQRQHELACGKGTQSLRNGFRGLLMNVAREEMMHFLAINNILMAMGCAFHVPLVDFGTFNAQVDVPLDFSLEAFALGSVQRFVALEQPHRPTTDVAGNDGPVARPYPYGSLSELYAAIRAGITTVSGAFLVRPGRGGGEHHLFLRRSMDQRHPDYQMQVDDVASAVFAIDFVTEHGEGGTTEPPGGAGEHSDGDTASHFDTFLRIGEQLMTERTTSTHGRQVPWTPAFPVLRNPTLRSGLRGMDTVTHEPARLAMEVFNRSYFMAMQLMVQHFGHNTDASLRRSRLMNWSLDIMTGVLRPLGDLIVTLPAGRVGRTAGPSFELPRAPEYLPRPDVAAAWMSREFAEIAQQARKCVGLSPVVADLLAFLGEQLADPDGGRP